MTTHTTTTAIARSISHTLTSRPSLYVCYPRTPGGTQVAREGFASMSDAWERTVEIAHRRSDLRGQDIRIETPDGRRVAYGYGP